MSVRPPVLYNDVEVPAGHSATRFVASRDLERLALSDSGAFRTLRSIVDRSARVLICRPMFSFSYRVADSNAGGSAHRCVRFVRCMGR